MSSKEQPIWTEAELETARTIVKRCGIRDGLFKGPRTLNAVESIAYALATVRREVQTTFVNNVAAVLDGDDVEVFTDLVMKAKASPSLDSGTRSSLKSEAETRREARAEAFREAVAIVIGQPTSHYIYSGAYPMATETFRDNAVKAIEATMAIERAALERAAKGENDERTTKE